MRRLLAALLLCWAAAPSAVLAAPPSSVTAATATAEQLLRRMDDAVAQQTYDGVFTYMRGDSVSSLRILHTIIGGVLYERLIHLDGTPREILRIGGNVLCVLLPNDELADLADDIPAGSFARAFVRNYRQIPGQYRLQLRGEGRVAGRIAQIVAIEPMDADRYGHLLWLDEATGMLLKSQLLRADGVPLEMFQFAQISLGRPIPLREFQPSNEPGKVVHRLALATPRRERPVAVGWQVGWLPRGFTMAAQNARPTAVGGAALQTLFYGDGLTTLSVFIEPIPAGAARSERAQVMREGATIALSITARNRDSRAFLVTVVGEVPVATAERVARSVLQKR